MGYRAEKLAVEEKLKIVKRIVLFCLLGILLALCIFSSFVPAETWKYYVSLPKVSKRQKGELRIHFLDVEQGDATIIELPDGQIMLIDGGNGAEKNTAKLLRYLNALKIKTVDHLLITHSDSDHCGGLDKVLKYKQVKRVYLPNVAFDVNAEYAECYAEILEKNCQKTLSSRNVEIPSTNAQYAYTLAFLYPYTSEATEENESAEENNDQSAVVWLDYNGVSVLFTGDAPKAVEEILIRDHTLGLFESRGVDLNDTEILKVSHHGSNDSTSEGFLRYLNVKTAVLSYGKDNMYGHPSKDVIDALKSVGTETYHTALDGHIMITIASNGDYKATKIAS